MVIIILDEFFIRCSDLLINFFIRIIDLIILFINKFMNKNDSNNEINSENKEIFKINNFFKNDSIFEELENRYSKNSSSNLSNSSIQSQNIFTSLKNNSYGTVESNDKKLKEDLNFDENIKEKIISWLLNNKYIEINESNFHNYISRIILMIFSILKIG